MLPGYEQDVFVALASKIISSLYATHCLSVLNSLYFTFLSFFTASDLFEVIILH